MICPRCSYSEIELLATSPIKGVWTVFQCQRCLYTWRNTEPARRTDVNCYPAEFRMTVQDIENAPDVPVIPPLLTK